jgi:hypothetical protein
VLGFFEVGSHKLIAEPQSFPSSAFQAARITGMSRWFLAGCFFCCFNNLFIIDLSLFF